MARPAMVSATICAVIAAFCIQAYPLAQLPHQPGRPRPCRNHQPVERLCVPFGMNGHAACAASGNPANTLAQMDRAPPRGGVEICLRRPFGIRHKAAVKERETIGCSAAAMRSTSAGNPARAKRNNHGKTFSEWRKRSNTDRGPPSFIDLGMDVISFEKNLCLGKAP